MTETLILAGVNIVGRTRFCIHPHKAVAAIPVVGGTKHFNVNEIRRLKPDLILLDKEENKKEMLLEEFQNHVVHVQNFLLLSEALEQLAAKINSPSLRGVAARALRIHQAEPRQTKQIPGLVTGLGPIENGAQKKIYVIWKDPWMAIGPQTFIWEVCNKLGLNLLALEKKYPEVSLRLLQKHFCLFSSEPYPFYKKKNDLDSLRLQGTFVDGEKYSWFGLRSIEFVERELGIY